MINIYYYLEKYEKYRQQDPKNHNMVFSDWIKYEEPLLSIEESKIFVCPKCDGEKTIEDTCVPSPKIGGGYYRPDCPLCNAKGYIIHCEVSNG